MIKIYEWAKDHVKRHPGVLAERLDEVFGGRRGGVSEDHRLDGVVGVVAGLAVLERGEHGFGFGAGSGDRGPFVVGLHGDMFPFWLGSHQASGAGRPSPPGQSGAIGGGGGTMKRRR
mgnify:CR=1 FL=1